MCQAWEAGCTSLARMSLHLFDVKVRSGIVLEKEPVLDSVREEDRTVVRNVIYTVMALNTQQPFCLGWSIQSTGRGYVLSFALCPDFSISLIDLQAIREVNPGRVENLILSSTAPEPALAERPPPPKGHVASLNVLVIDSQQRVMHYEADIVRVRKRSRLSFL